MPWAESMRADNFHEIELGGRRVDCRLITSKSARRLRVRVGLDGVVVIKPANRTKQEVSSFLERSSRWIIGQLKRIERLQEIRAPRRKEQELLFRGERIPVRVEGTTSRSR